MVAFSVAFDKLAQFQTAEEIRSFLQHEGITGHRAIAGGCPVAVWMTRATGVKCGAYAHVFNYNEDGSIGESYVETPTAMFTFIKEFDSGYYPELVAMEGV